MENLIIKIHEVSTNGDIIVLPITVDNFIDISAFNLSIEYDSSKIELIPPTKLPINSGYIGFNYDTKGLIKFGWFTYPALTLANNSVLIELEFKKILTSKSPITFKEDFGFSTSKYESILNVTYIDGSIEFFDEANVPIIEPEPVEELPTFPIKSKVNERKETIKYTSKQIISKKCDNCSRRIGTKCTLGNFSTTNGGICDYHKNIS